MLQFYNNIHMIQKLVYLESNILILPYSISKIINVVWLPVRIDTLI